MANLGIRDEVEAVINFETEVQNISTGSTLVCREPTARRRHGYSQSEDETRRDPTGIEATAVNHRLNFGRYFALVDDAEAMKINCNPQHQQRAISSVCWSSIGCVFLLFFCSLWLGSLGSRGFASEVHSPFRMITST